MKNYPGFTIVENEKLSPMKNKASQWKPRTQQTHNVAVTPYQCRRNVTTVRRKYVVLDDVAATSIRRFRWRCGDVNTMLWCDMCLLGVSNDSSLNTPLCDWIMNFLNPCIYTKKSSNTILDISEKTTKKQQQKKQNKKTTTKNSNNKKQTNKTNNNKKTKKQKNKQKNKQTKTKQKNKTKKNKQNKTKQKNKPHTHTHTTTTTTTKKKTTTVILKLPVASSNLVNSQHVGENSRRH